MDTTVIISYAGGMREMRIRSKPNGGFNLEFLVANDDLEIVPDKYNSTQTFKTAEECWNMVGKIVGWVKQSPS